MTELPVNHYKAIAGWFLLPREENLLLELAVPRPQFEGHGITEIDGVHEVAFSGLIKIFGSSLNSISGRVIDYYGKSSLNGDISESTLSFEKRYDSRPRDVIKYNFIKEGDLWIGKFEDRLSSDGAYRFIGQPAQLQIFNFNSSTAVQRLLIKPEVTKIA